MRQKRYAHKKQADKCKLMFGTIELKSSYHYFCFISGYPWFTLQAAANISQRSTEHIKSTDEFIFSTNDISSCK